MAERANEVRVRVGGDEDGAVALVAEIALLSGGAGASGGWSSGGGH